MKVFDRLLKSRRAWLLIGLFVSEDLMEKLQAFMSVLSSL